MTLLGIAIAGAWIVTLLTMLLTLALVRRVNMLAAQVATQISASAADLGLNEGEPLPAFEARDLNGRPTSSGELIDDKPALLALLSATCQSCRDQVAQFNAVSRDASRAGWVSVAVVSGTREAAADLIAAIGPDTTILVNEDQDAQLMRDLRLNYSPTYYAVARDGRVASREFSAQPLSKVLKSPSGGLKA